MDVTGYTTLARQSGLLREMQSIANNIANISTTGFRKERVLFSEYVTASGFETPSVSMASARVRDTDLAQATLRHTGAALDIAIEGQGFFLIATPNGEALTRAGSFTALPDGRLANPHGHRLLDLGGAEIQLPADATAITIGQDGTISANAAPVAQIGLWEPVGPIPPKRQDGVIFPADGAVAPAANGGTILQGFLEGSNVSPVTEMARMVQVQRAYELGQGLMDREDERIRTVIRTLVQQS